MKRFLLFVSVLAVLYSLPSAAQVAPQRTAPDDEALLRKWIGTLGSDDFGGRLPMTPYEARTINYLAAEMEALGLQPGFGDSWFQGRNMTYYGRWTYKFEQAERLGAAGCLVLHNTAAASYGWNVAANHTGPNLALYDEATRNAGTLAMKGWLHEDG